MSLQVSKVICRQLQFYDNECEIKNYFLLILKSVIGAAYSDVSFFVKNSTPLVTYQFNCNGNENSLQCFYINYGQECYSFQTYGLYCAGNNFWK